jgi:hypothetical protein
MKIMIKTFVIRAITSIFLIGICSIRAFSQAEYSDVCHVYVVDALKALKLQDLYFETAEPETDEKYLKLKKQAETDFPEFKTKIGEEELTTKYFRFPKSKLIITASVFYTDDYIGDEMVLGIAVSGKRWKSAIGYPPIGGAIADFTLNEKMDLVRVKQYIKVLGRNYLVGMQCDLAAKRQYKKEEEKR